MSCRQVADQPLNFCCFPLLCYFWFCRLWFSRAIWPFVFVDVLDASFEDQKVRFPVSVKLDAGFVVPLDGSPHYLTIVEDDDHGGLRFHLLLIVIVFRMSLLRRNTFALLRGDALCTSQSIRIIETTGGNTRVGRSYILFRHSDKSSDSIFEPAISIGESRNKCNSTGRSPRAQGVFSYLFYGGRFGIRS